MSDYFISYGSKVDDFGTKSPTLRHLRAYVKPKRDGGSGARTARIVEMSADETRERVVGVCRRGKGGKITCTRYKSPRWKKA